MAANAYSTWPASAWQDGIPASHAQSAALGGKGQAVGHQRCRVGVPSITVKGRRGEPGAARHPAALKLDTLPKFCLRCALPNDALHKAVKTFFRFLLQVLFRFRAYGLDELKTSGPGA